MADSSILRLFYSLFRGLPHLHYYYYFQSKQKQKIIYKFFCQINSTNTVLVANEKHFYIFYFNKFKIEYCMRIIVAVRQINFSWCALIDYS